MLLHPVSSTLSTLCSGNAFLISSYDGSNARDTSSSCSLQTEPERDVNAEDGLEDVNQTSSGDGEHRSDMLHRPSGGCQIQTGQCEEALPMSRLRIRT